MKIICLKNDLEKVVSRAEKITGKNLSLSVLKGIFFSIKNKIIINATNLDLGIKIEVPGKILKEGDFIIDGGTLNSFLSNINENKKLNLELKDNNLLVTGDNIKTSISVLPKCRNNRPKTLRRESSSESSPDYKVCVESDVSPA